MGTERRFEIKSAGAPSFFYPIYAVCSAHAEDELIAIALGP
jgi:hypothetical protein